MHKVCAGIVTFNPEIERLIENIESVSSQVDKIFIVDNGSDNYLDILKMVEGKFITREVIIKRNENNEGIAQALNILLSIAFNLKYEWIITLDQDSICERNLIRKYFYAIDNYFDQKSIGIIGPQKFLKQKKTDVQSQLTETMYVITSGALTNIKYAISSGGFEEKYFIDTVDWELCIKLRLNRYKVFIATNTFIDHQLGEQNSYSFFGKTISYSEHSFLRYYYLNRNTMDIFKRYFQSHPREVLWIIKRVINKNIKMLLFEESKVKKMKMIIIGLRDGYISKLGKFHSRS